MPSRENVSTVLWTLKDLGTDLKSMSVGDLGQGQGHQCEMVV